MVWIGYRLHALILDVILFILFIFVAVADDAGAHLKRQALKRPSSVLILYREAADNLPGAVSHILTQIVA